MSSIGLPKHIRTKDDAYVQGVADGGVQVARRLRKALRKVEITREGDEFYVLAEDIDRIFREEGA